MSEEDADGKLADFQKMGAKLQTGLRSSLHTSPKKDIKGYPDGTFAQRSS